eukprot:CAMPEP_0117426954 /NCGR_PEP_ID=MMETSP0758-20121206/6925_1 /TAXON_ID=63605 /ORGANISM="Percolomonas cosmopolitus, Strain AE-1 (ATCC 50343)" /LENGTH=354 /DNA_ID=CAMNT_0005212353 /DNA_START=75 /DNA_END=1135 /DNA_ORIENTATION=+
MNYMVNKKAIRKTNDILDSIRIRNQMLSPSQKQNVRVLHSQLLRNYVNERQESSLERESADARNRIDRQRTKEKIFYAAFFIALMAVVIFSLGHLLNPYRSTIDTIMIMILGNQYRTYENISGLFFESPFYDEPTLVYCPIDDSFEMVIPKWLEFNGVWIADNVGIHSGTVSIRDVNGLEMQCDWIPIKNQLAANGQTQFTPIKNVLQGCVYSQLKRYESMLEGIDVNFRCQRAEYISPEAEDILLDPVSSKPKGASCIMVNRVREGNWEAHIWFLSANERIHHIMHRYSENLINELYKDYNLVNLSQENRSKKLSLILRNRVYDQFQQSNFPLNISENSMTKPIIPYEAIKEV